jgi:hypothetical protein
MTPEHHEIRLNVHKLARIALFGFIVTFILARAFVLMIMSGTIHNFYFFLQGTHVHHLNYGIFLLAAVSGYAVFRRPLGRPRSPSTNSGCGSTWAEATGSGPASTW